MGKIFYGTGRREVEFDDRTLAHLKIVILSKLRRGESFALNITHDLARGSGRSTLWMHPGVAVEFVFRDNQRPEFNRDWIENMLHAANTADGLTLLPEPKHEHPSS